MNTIALKLIAISLVITYRQFKHNLVALRQICDDEYDYVVVGAGAAGCVVAARLAEDISKKVLLLEAGGPQTMMSDMPAKQSSLTGTDLDWNYQMVRQNNAYFARTDGQFNFPRGRVFGGSSVLNAMNYYRENPEYFELWDKIHGIKNWTFNDVLPYFLKSENNLDSHIVQKSNGFHRAGGELSVSTAIPDNILDKYLKVAQMMGYNETYADGREPFGVSVMQRTIEEGIRQSSSVAFLESNFKSNLHTVGYSRVTKILFDNKKRAIGVIFCRKGVNFTVKARKEVIISAGVIESPKLLMLSGIGPNDHLKHFNITLISNLKVGQNLLHSVYIELNFDIKNQSEISKPDLSLENKYSYFVEHSGPLAYKASGVQCFREVNYENYTQVSNGCVLPRIDFLDENLEKLVKNHELKNEWEDYYRPYLGRAYFKLLAVIRKPKSYGTLRLKSDNPFVNPLIDPCVFCVKSDIDDMVSTMKLSLDIYKSPYFQEYATIFNNSIPGCNPCVDYYFCDSYLRCIAQTVTNHLYACGTCRMGFAFDDNAVVDERFRVKGVTGVRVIDSSVLPVCSEQTYAISLMIGERGAQFIKDDTF